MHSDALDIQELKRLHDKATREHGDGSKHLTHSHTVTREFAHAMYNAFPELIARLEAAEAAMQWRPISEAHEDWGVCVFINIHEPEPICASTMDDDFAETAKRYGWTHFRRITLTHEDAAALIAALPAPPEAAR